ncbi:MAG: hypothetical protein JXM73_03395 [Anaerolineae bacterium]|nr:hypothetical protein [Anaerolineae bacterium]
MARFLIASLVVILLAGCTGPIAGETVTGSPTDVDVDTNGASQVITK